MARQPAKVVRSRKFASRRREVRRQYARRRRRVTFSVVGLLMLTGGGWALARSSLFALEGIEVTGTKQLSQADVVQASGLHRGQSMLSLHADRVRERIARLPLVRRVSVDRIPTSRIRITVVERVAAFVLTTTESRWYIDDEATLLGDAAGDSPSLPRIHIDAPLSSDTGDRATIPALADALGLWKALPDSLKAGAPTIDATSAEGLTLVRSDYDIRFGTLEQMPEKLQAISLVLERARRTRDRVVMVDVRSPSRPAARMS